MTWRARLRLMLPYVAALGGGFLLAYLIVAFFVFPAGVIPQDLRVPNVIGLNYPDAVRQLEQKGFSAERTETRFHNAAPKGTVLDQTPPPASREAPGIKVSLVVSGGQRVVAVPGVVGLSRENAIAALEAAGFEVGDATPRPSNQPMGTVIDSRPRPGTQAPMPSTVSLVVSAGPTIVVVPDVVGRSVSDARLLLRQVGLDVGEILWGATGAAVSDASAVVISQSPPSGSQAASGSRVNVNVGTRAP